MTEQPIHKINNGLVLGLLLSALTIILYIFDFQYNTSVSLIYYLIIFVYPFILVFTLKNIGELSLKDTITGLIKVCLVGALFYSIFWVLYLYFINPEFSDVIWEMQKKNLLSKGFEESFLEEKKVNFQTLQKPYIMGISTFFTLSFVSMIGSVIAGIVRRK